MVAKRQGTHKFRILALHRTGRLSYIFPSPLVHSLPARVLSNVGRLLRNQPVINKCPRVGYNNLHASSNFDQEPGDNLGGPVCIL
jgi:hypothetical protein